MPSEFFKFCGLLLGVAFAIYVAVRLGTAAFYQSKKDYERSKQHGSK